MLFRMTVPILTVEEKKSKKKKLKEIKKKRKTRNENRLRRKTTELPGDITGERFGHRLRFRNDSR